MEDTRLNKNKKAFVYESLKKRIIDLDLEPGSPIIEAEYAEELGVSKTPIREALRHLERDGFVINVPSRGSMVTHITTQEIHNLFQIREIIESGAAKIAARSGDKSAFEAVRARNDQVIREIDAIEEAAYADEWQAWDDIHHVIIKSLSNAALLDVYLGLLDRIHRVRNYYGKRLTKQRYLDIVREHNTVADAIIAGDGPGAEAAMQGHLRKASQYLLGIGMPEGG